MTSSVVSEMNKRLVSTILEADNFLYKGQFDKSYKILSTIISIFDRYDEYSELDLYKGHIYERKGRLLLEWKVYNAALLMFIKALDRYSIQDDILGQACVYGNIGMCHQALGDKYKAIEYYLEHVILSSKHREPDKLESMDSTTLVNKLAVKYLATALNISQAIDEKLGLVNHSNRLNWFSQVKDNYIKALELCKYQRPVSVFKQMSSCPTESNLAARLNSLRIGDTASFTNRSYLGSFLQVSTLAKMSSNFFLEAISATNIAHTSLYIGDYNKAIQTANSAISLFLSYRHTCTLDQLPDSFDEEERKAYAWLILAQVKSKLLFDALLSCEKYRYQMLAKITNNQGFSPLEFHLFDVSKLKDILVTLKLTTIYYYVIQFEDLDPQMIIWLVQPQPQPILTPLSQKKVSEIEIKCHIVDLPSYNIGDIREWVLQCRYALEFSCCSCSCSIDDDDNSQPNNTFNSGYNTTTTHLEKLVNIHTCNGNSSYRIHSTNSDSLHQESSTSLHKIPSTSSLNSLSTRITQSSSAKSHASTSTSLTTTSQTKTSSLTVPTPALLLVLFLHSVLLLAAGGLLILFSPFILLVESFRFFLIIFISVSNNQMSLFLKILRIIYDHLQLKCEGDTPPQLPHRHISFLPSFITLLRHFFGVSSTTDVIRKLHSKYLSRQIVTDTRKCDNTATNACQSMYDVLFMVFESELSAYEDGLDLAIVTHDILGLVPFSALMDSKGIYLINKYKLRRIPSIFMIWDLFSNQSTKSRKSRSRSRKRHSRENNSSDRIKNEFDNTVTDRLVRGEASVVPVDSLECGEAPTPRRGECSVTTLHSSESTTSATTRNTCTGDKRSISHSPVNRERNIVITSLNQYLSDQGKLQLASVKRSTLKACVLDLSPRLRNGFDVGIPGVNGCGVYNTLPGSSCCCPPTLWHASELYKLFEEASDLRPDVVILRSCFMPSQSDERGRGRGGEMIATFDWLDGIVRALHCSGVPCVIFSITELSDTAALSILNHFYQALLGIAELDITTGTTPLDSIEALQAAVFRQMFTSDNYAHPCRWSGLVLSGIPVDMRGRSR